MNRHVGAAGLWPSAETVLAEEPAPPPSPPRALGPEERFLIAWLKQAMADYCLRGASPQCGRLRRDAADWFADPGEGQHSYRWLCALLGLDPEYLWRERARWRQWVETIDTIADAP